MAGKRKRRGNGEGSVFKRADGRWGGQYMVDTPNGQKRRSVYGETRHEAEDCLKQAMARCKSEINEAEREALERRQKTVSVHIVDYLVDIRKPDTSEDAPSI